MAFWTAGVGEGGVLLRFGVGIDEETSSTLLSFLSFLEESPKKPEGIIQILPSYASLLIQFDPLIVSRATIEEWCYEVEKTTKNQEKKQELKRNVVEIPVKYGGDGGPDLEKVAEMCGISTEEVIKLHTDPEYRVYFLGFVGGFPYLGGLSPSLSKVPRLSTPRPLLPPGTVGIAAGQTVPRLSTPRPLLPPGTVGIAAGQTGIYPIPSPGGWHCLGQTPLSLFSPLSSPPLSSLLVIMSNLLRIKNHKKQPQETTTTTTTTTTTFPPWIQIINPGPQTTVQDIGRPQYGRFGVSKSGVCDTLALNMVNSLLGNEKNAAVLEVVMGGFEFVVVCEWCSIAITGANFGGVVVVGGVGHEIPLRMNEVIVLQKKR